jgi:hypothetical protein
MDRPDDVAAAATLLNNGNGWAVWIGDSNLDPYVQQSFDHFAESEWGHPNGGVCGNCKTEASKLIDYARQLQFKDLAESANYAYVTSDSQDFAYALSDAVAGAINALNAYGQAYGPGLGIVTATSSNGTTVLAAGPVGGQSYAGAGGSGLAGGTYSNQQFGGGNFGGVGPNGFGGLGAGFGGIGGGFAYGIGGQGFGGVGNNSAGMTFGGGPLKKF